MTYTADVPYTGIDDQPLGTFTAKLPDALQAVKKFHDSGELPYLRLPFERDDLTALQPLADEFRQFETVIVLGTGGSSLGGKTVYALADHGFGNTNAGCPKLIFLDNVDPATFDALFASHDMRRCGVLAVSKSGTTAETLAQLFVIIPQLQKANSDGWTKQVVAITEPKTNILRQFADKHGIRTLEHDPQVGGRFSVLSIVGLLPAMIAGVDAQAIRDGAADVLKPALDGDTSIAAAHGAAWSMAHAMAGKNQTVLLPYIDQFADFGMWYRQLWAESLGKNGNGTTPIRAMGTVDQHSQVQLYLDGPSDKIFTVLVKDAHGQGDVIDRSLASDDRLGYLAGRTMGDLLVAEQEALVTTLVNNHKPVRVLRIDAVTPRALGGLFMHYMLETIIAAQLLGINAFDQPAVEQGKVLTRQYLEEMR